jgi:pilus assembly protein TadC
MNKISPKKLIFIGAGLLLLGVLIPFLIVLDVLESTFFLNFSAYACQVSGLFIGMYGTFATVKIFRGKR